MTADARYLARALTLGIVIGGAAAVVLTVTWLAVSAVVSL